MKNAFNNFLKISQLSNKYTNVIALKTDNTMYISTVHCLTNHFFYSIQIQQTVQKL